jgi:hypothetical protein
VGDDPGVTAPSNRPDSPTPRPLSNWAIAAGALVVLAVAAVVSFVLLRRYGGQEATVQLDAIRTAGTLVIGTGGEVALLLTARRQRYTELALVHTDRDATERGASLSCTPRPPINSAPTRPRYGWLACTPWSA